MRYYLQDHFRDYEADMAGYMHEPMAELTAQLSAGLLRLRKGYVDAAEALLRIIDDRQEYPYEFVVYRLTGYRGRYSSPPPPMSGPDLRADLLQLMLDVSGSFSLPADAYGRKAWDSAELARELNVSTKTIRRWRRRGLPARRLVFPDGRRRIGFIAGSVHWFRRTRSRQLTRSMKFSQLDLAQREEIIRRARRMAQGADCSLAEVSRRVAATMGRAVETVRYTIRRHDIEQPARAIFPHLTGPLRLPEKEVIYRCFLHGVPVARLAVRYSRTRGSIYRVVNEMRARQLLDRKIDYIYCPQFDQADADERILSDDPDRQDGDDAVESPVAARRPGDLPPYLRALYDVPLLSRQGEQELFRRYNYLKHKASLLRGQLDLSRIRSRRLREIENLLLRANHVKNRIVRSNLRLVVSIAKKHIGGPQTLFELISDGNVSLMKAVEKFDFARGNRFSTYASWAIMRNFARSVPREVYRLDRSTGQDDMLDVLAQTQAQPDGEINIRELRESIDVVLAQLTGRERTILVQHYGLKNPADARTLDQIGQEIGLSKERVRQIEIAALRKLRAILSPQQTDLLS